MLEVVVVVDVVYKIQQNFVITDSVKTYTRLQRTDFYSLRKSKYFPPRYKRKSEWVFFLNTVYVKLSKILISLE